jgi:hypothetical protein
VKTKAGALEAILVSPEMLQAARPERDKSIYFHA